MEFEEWFELAQEHFAHLEEINGWEDRVKIDADNAREDYYFGLSPEESAKTFFDDLYS